MKKPAKSAKKLAVTPSGSAPSASTEGQRRLLALTQTTSEIAASCGVSRSSVSHWRSGRKSPQLTARAELERAFGIPRLAWDRPAGWQPSETVTPPVTPTKAVTPSSHPVTPFDDGPVTPSATTLEEVNARIAALRKLEHVEGITPAELLKLADTEGKLLSIKLRIERDEELREDRIVRSPWWARVKAIILEVLDPFPEAHRALEERLGRMEDSTR